MRIVRGWGVRPTHLERIYLGLNVDVAVRTPARLEAKTLFSVGRFVPWKGFSFVLDLVAAFPSWQAVLAGDGPLKEELMAKARTLGIENRVRFTGPLPHEEVLGWCADADVFVLDTSFESFSFQVLEAMAMGAAIVTTRVGSLPELIEDGVEGMLCTPDDMVAFRNALTSIEQEPQVWDARRAAAKRKATQFSLDASADTFMKSVIRVCA
jgi:glycosyltransferase involved in cell wall biosynthesis